LSENFSCRNKIGYIKMATSNQPLEYVYQMHNICGIIDTTYNLSQLRIYAEMSGLKEIDGVPVAAASKKQLCAAVAENLRLIRAMKGRGELEDYADVDEILVKAELPDEDYEFTLFKNPAPLFLDGGMKQAKKIVYNIIAIHHNS
jgi:hypothetical protein